MCRTDGFIVECYDGGETSVVAEVDTSLSLLNDVNLEIITRLMDMRKKGDEFSIPLSYGFSVTLTEDYKGGNLFVRRAMDTTEGYFMCNDGRWAYGTRERAENEFRYGYKKD